MRKTKIVPPEQLTTKTLAPADYLGTITVQCVNNKKHTRVLTPAEAAQDVPLCHFDGSPMIAVKAMVRRKGRR